MKVEGLERAATAVRATTNGSRAANSWEASESTSASAASLGSTPNESREEFPSRLWDPTFPTKRDEVEHATANKEPFLIFPEIPFKTGERELFFNLKEVEFLGKELEWKNRVVGVAWKERHGTGDIAREPKVARRRSCVFSGEVWLWKGIRGLISYRAGIQLFSCRKHVNKL